MNVRAQFGHSSDNLINDPLSGGHGKTQHARSSDLRLLVRLIQKDTAGIERCLSGQEQRLSDLAESCYRSGLSVVLLKALEGSPLQSAIVPSRLQSMREVQRRRNQRQKIIGKELIILADHFQSAGQPFILLKGPYLANRFYGDVLGREFVDLDILIPYDDRKRASALLKNRGFRRKSKVLLSEKLTSCFVHAFDYHNGSLNLDLHWDLSCHPSLRLDMRKLWAERATYPVGEHIYNVLSDEHEVIFAALSLLRDIERGRPKAKNIIDIIQILTVIDRKLAWEELLSAVDGTAGPLRNVLGQCLEIADAHDLAPRLSATLNHRTAPRVLPAGAGSPLKFLPSRFGLGNKVWAARTYESSHAVWLAWWVVSLPFRITAHRPSSPPVRQHLRGSDSV